MTKVITKQNTEEQRNPIIKVTQYSAEPVVYLFNQHLFNKTHLSKHMHHAVQDDISTDISLAVMEICPVFSKAAMRVDVFQAGLTVILVYSRLYSLSVCSFVQARVLFCH